MLEYLIIPFTDESRENAQTMLNELARRGYRVICYTPVGLVLEREMTPQIEESPTKTVFTFNHAI